MVLQGSGCFYGLGGERYNGQWEKGKRHGMGTQTYRDWNAKGEVYHKYHGMWVNGKREGRGHLTMCKPRHLGAPNPSSSLVLHCTALCEFLHLVLSSSVANVAANGNVYVK